MVYFGPNFFLQLVNSGFCVRILCVIVQPPKPTFLLDEIQDGLTNTRFGVTAAVHFRCGCIDCLRDYVNKVTASSLSSSCMVIFVSISIKLSFSVLCVKSSFVSSNRYRGSVSGVFRLSGLSSEI